MDPFAELIIFVLLLWHVDFENLQFTLAWPAVNLFSCDLFKTKEFLPLSLKFPIREAQA